jgi:hypothetical protein
MPPTDLVLTFQSRPRVPLLKATVEVQATSGYGVLNFTIIAFGWSPTTTYPTQTGKGVPTSFAGLPPGDYIK